MLSIYSTYESGYLFTAILNLNGYRSLDMQSITMFQDIKKARINQPWVNAGFKIYFYRYVICLIYRSCFIFWLQEVQSDR